MRTERSPERKMIEKIIIEVQLPPEFPEKYTNAVLKAVDACSVKAHMVEPPAFELKAKIG